MHLFSDVLAWFLCISSHTVFPHRRQDPARAPGSRTFPNPAAALTLSWDFELRFPYVTRSLADRSSGQPGPHTSTQYPSTDLRRHSASRGTPRVSDGSRYQIRCHGGRFGRDFLLEPVNLKSMLVSRPPRAQYRGEPRDKFVFSDPSSDRLFKGYSHARPPPEVHLSCRCIFIAKVYLLHVRWQWVGVGCVSSRHYVYTCKTHVFWLLALQSLLGWQM